jgi:hypothetical protein
MTAGFPPSTMTSTPPRSQCWRRPCRFAQGLHDSQDPRMVPALGMPSPVRRGRLPRPRRPPPPAARGAALGLRRQHVAQHRQCRTTRKRRPTSSRRGPTTIGRHSNSWTCWSRQTGAGRGAHAIQDLKTSARSTHRPSSPVQESKSHSPKPLTATTWNYP